MNYPVFLWIVRRNIPDELEYTHNWTQTRMQQDAQNFALRLFKWVCVDFAQPELYCCVASSSPLLNSLIVSNEIKSKQQLYFHSRTFTVHMVDLTDIAYRHLQQNSSTDFSMQNERLFWKKAKISFRRTRPLETIVDWMNNELYNNVSLQSMQYPPINFCHKRDIERGIRVLDVWAECLINVREQGVACRILEETSALLHYLLILNSVDAVKPLCQLSVQTIERKKHLKQNVKSANTKETTVLKRNVVLSPETQNKINAADDSIEFQEEMANWFLIN